MKQPAGGFERHYAVAVEGTVVTFECKAGHTYTKDMAAKSIPISKRLPAWWCQRMLRYWGKANDGVNCRKIDCPKCKRAVRKPTKDDYLVKGRTPPGPQK